VATAVAIALSVPGLAFLIMAAAIAIVLLAPTVAIALMLDDGDL
jgi:hypothetical protein